MSFVASKLNLLGLDTFFFGGHTRIGVREQSFPVTAFDLRSITIDLFLFARVHQEIEQMMKGGIGTI